MRLVYRTATGAAIGGLIGWNFGVLGLLCFAVGMFWGMLIVGDL